MGSLIFRTSGGILSWSEDGETRVIQSFKGDTPVTITWDDGAEEQEANCEVCGEECVELFKCSSCGRFMCADCAEYQTSYVELHETDDLGRCPLCIADDTP